MSMIVCLRLTATACVVFTPSLLATLAHLHMLITSLHANTELMSSVDSSALCLLSWLFVH